MIHLHPHHMSHLHPHHLITFTTSSPPLPRFLTGVPLISLCFERDLNMCTHGLARLLLDITFCCCVLHTTCCIPFTQPHPYTNQVCDINIYVHAIIASVFLGGGGRGWGWGCIWCASGLDVVTFISTASSHTGLLHTPCHLLVSLYQPRGSS